MALYYIKARTFCCGAVTDDDGRVIEAAPIIRWCVGKPIGALLTWLRVRHTYLSHEVIGNGVYHR